MAEGIAADCINQKREPKVIQLVKNGDGAAVASDIIKGIFFLPLI